MPDQNRKPCPICLTKTTLFVPGSGSCYVECIRCGHYRMGKLTQPYVELPEFHIPRHILSGITRNYWETTGQPFEITNEMIQSTDALIKASPVIVPQPEDVARKAELILRHLKRLSSFPGTLIDCAEECSVGFCQNDDEFKYLLGYLKQRQLVENLGPPEYKDGILVLPHHP